MALRRATPADAPWLLGLVRDERIAASLSPRAVDTLQDALEDPDAGVLVIEADGERAGVACWSAKNRRSRIASVHTLAVAPDRQGGGLAVAALRELAGTLFHEQGFHRIEAETYGFNSAGRRVFAAAGFSEEGIRRRAYDRHGDWQDGVHFGLLAEEYQSG